jgi:hypothetical protein
MTLTKDCHTTPPQAAALGNSPYVQDPVTAPQVPLLQVALTVPVYPLEQEALHTLPGSLLWHGDIQAPLGTGLAGVLGHAAENCTQACIRQLCS